MKYQVDYQSHAGNRYKEKVLTIGNWALHRRDDEINEYHTGYLAMIGHNCPSTTVYRLRNGERRQFCGMCGNRIPDEIWGLWHLLCNDQRRGFK